MNSTLRFLGGITRFVFYLIKGKYKKISHFVDPFWRRSSDIDSLIDRDNKNWNVGLVMALILVVLIYLFF